MGNQTKWVQEVPANEGEDRSLIIQVSTDKTKVRKYEVNDRVVKVKRKITTIVLTEDIQVG
jgi:hypothetical protein